MAGHLDLAERLAAIVSTQEAIASIRLDPDSVMQIAVDHVRKITRCDGAVLEMIRDEEFHYHTTSGSLDAHQGTVFDIEGSLSGECIKLREVLYCDDTEADSRVNADISRVTGSRSIIVVPLIFEDEVVAVLKVVSAHPRHFGDLDRYSLQVMGGFIAASLAQAKRYRAQLASEQRFRLLFERNLAAAFFTTPDGRILEVNDALVRLLGFSTKEEALGDKVWTHYEKRTDREAMLDILKAQKTVTRHPLRLKRNDGRVISVLTNIDMVRGEKETFLIGTLLETPDDD